MIFLRCSIVCDVAKLIHLDHSPPPQQLSSHYSPFLPIPLHPKIPFMLVSIVSWMQLNVRQGTTDATPDAVSLCWRLWFCLTELRHTDECPIRLKLLSVNAHLVQPINYLYTHTFWIYSWKVFESAARYELADSPQWSRKYIQVLAKCRE